MSRGADRPLLEARYGALAKTDQDQEPPLQHLATWKTDPVIASLVSLHSSAKEARHKLTPGSCWAYFASCSAVRTMLRGCCDSCNGQRHHRPEEGKPASIAATPRESCQRQNEYKRT